MKKFPATFIAKKRGILAFAVVTVLVAGMFMLSRTTPDTQIMFGDIPLPFGTKSTDVRGSISSMGKRNGIDVFEVTFNGDALEHLQTDKIYLVHVPNSPDVQNVPLDLTLGLWANPADHHVDYYGYKYTDASASTERRDINATRFADRFPGKFFASKTAWDADSAHGNALANFQTDRAVTFLHTDNRPNGVRLDPSGSLYVFIVNTTGGAGMRIQGIIGCGNAVKESGEDCDDGNTVNDDECSNACTSTLPIPFDDTAVCGDGTKTSPETCDDGNKLANDGCDSECTVETGFTCDGKPSVCTPHSLCSNGELDEAEDCDDGNATDDDGCSDVCTIETGYSCSGEPSVCTPDDDGSTCGNGVVEEAEQCDDQNTENADGCSDMCTTEDGYTCMGSPSSCLTYVDYTDKLADGTIDGNVSDMKNLLLAMKLMGDLDKPFSEVPEDDINGDGTFDDADMIIFMDALAVLTPEA